MAAFSVLDWAAWAPGLQKRAAWMAWAHAPFLPSGDDAPPLTEVPTMQRRRIDRLGRMAIQVAYWCQEQAGGSLAPMLFASRHGNAVQSVELLKALAADQALSPTTFGLSVHNAIAALYSITSGSRANYLSIAGGCSTAEAACIEATGLLEDGAPEVRLVCYEAPLPQDYTAYADEAQAFYAWCWRIAPARCGRTQLQLHRESRKAAPISPPTSQNVLPHGLDVHRFLLSGDSALSLCDGTGTWHWNRHG